MDQQQPQPLAFVPSLYLSSVFADRSRIANSAATVADLLVNSLMINVMFVSDANHSACIPITVD